MVIQNYIFYSLEKNEYLNKNIIDEFYEPPLLTTIAEKSITDNINSPNNILLLVKCC